MPLPVGIGSRQRASCSSADQGGGKRRGVYLDQQQSLCDEVELPANRSAYAVLKDDLKNETGGTTHSILRIASWITKIGGSIKGKIPLRGVVDLIRDANSTVISRVEIAVRTLSHQWAGCKKGPAENAGRDGRSSWAFRVGSGVDSP